MKTKKILIALSIAIFTSVNFFANAITVNGKNESDTTQHRMDIRVNDNNQVVIRANCTEAQKWVNFVLKVYSDNGNMMFAESYHKKGGIYKGFDMSKLPEGKYSFEIHQNLKKVYARDVVKSSSVVSVEDGNTRMVVQLIN